mmetsp:Transcript_48812/g.104475  ORF Transcript_48812/g.104475 Transcript_48812/m.104475 type:complete len:324 (+) Transcript_48812:687-1658(+)
MGRAPRGATRRAPPVGGPSTSTSRPRVPRGSSPAPAAECPRAHAAHAAPVGAVPGADLRTGAAGATPVARCKAEAPSNLCPSRACATMPRTLALGRISGTLRCGTAALGPTLTSARSGTAADKTVNPVSSASSHRKSRTSATILRTRLRTCRMAKRATTLRVSGTRPVAPAPWPPGAPAQRTACGLWMRVPSASRMTTSAPGLDSELLLPSLVAPVWTARREAMLASSRSASRTTSTVTFLGAPEVAAWKGIATGAPTRTSIAVTSKLMRLSGGSGRNRARDPAGSKLTRGRRSSLAGGTPSRWASWILGKTWIRHQKRTWYP